MSFGSCTTRGPFKRGYIGKIFRQILSTPFRSKIDQNSLKTTPRGVGRMSRGIGQVVASSSPNMSPWGPMADPFVPDFFSFSPDMNVLVWEFSGLWTLRCPGVSRSSLGVSGASGGVSWGSPGYSMLFGLPLPGLHKSYLFFKNLKIS